MGIAMSPRGVAVAYACGSDAHGGGWCGCCGGCTWAQPGGIVTSTAPRGASGCDPRGFLAGCVLARLLCGRWWPCAVAWRAAGGSSDAR
ncbi:hypothetical protein M8J76_002177 [Diaphorina citri]|nr:hypothetical protein M8J76_002177 [Diaphorina citri]